MRHERPTSVEGASEALRQAAADGETVRFRGGGTKPWGSGGRPPDREVSTAALDQIEEHNAADLTAVVEAGVPLARAQELFATKGQMLALDPPLGAGAAATVGGVIAAADSGPLRHRYGGPRDLLLGMTVVLSDGTVATSGGTVIKNVAGYDLAKLFTGSMGTLGLIVRVAVRLHPLPARRATAVGETGDPERLRRAAVAMAAAPLELESLDVSWRDGVGRLLARCGGVATMPRAERAAGIMSAHGLGAGAVEDDEDAWAAQRDGQRSGDGVVVRVSALPSAIGRVVVAAERVGSSLVGRAAAGVSWVRLPVLATEESVAAVEELRSALAPFSCVVQDAPFEVREKVDVWGTRGGATIELARRVKQGFDPAGICNPGVFVGSI